MPELFPNPERFDPSRWFSIRPTPFEYFPFSAGQRVCIGKYMATMLMKVSLATIVQRATIRVVPDTRIDRSVKVTLAPKGGLPVTISPAGAPWESSPVRGNIHEMVEL